MNKFDVCSIKDLKKGDYFYFLKDKKKKVMKINKRDLNLIEVLLTRSVNNNIYMIRDFNKQIVYLHG